MDTKINKMREKHEKMLEKIAELEAQAAKLEKEIEQAETEQLGFLARSAANNLSGGMADVFALLRGLKVNHEQNKTDAPTDTSVAVGSQNIKKSNENKEGESVDETGYKKEKDE